MKYNFREYVAAARNRSVPSFSRRHDDFPDTIPVGEATDVNVETIYPERRAGNEGAELLARAQLIVARTAFQHLLWQGYFPPRCQKCGK